MAKKQAGNSLTDQQLRFVSEYLIDLNGTKAAARAGYTGQTDVRASQLLSIRKIQDEIAKRFSAQQKRLQLKADDVILELYRILTSDIAEAYAPDGKMKLVHDIPLDVRRAISGIETEEWFQGSGDEKRQVGWIRKVKFWSKTDAAQMLGKHLKLWIEKVEHEHKFSLEDLVNLSGKADE